MIKSVSISGPQVLQPEQLGKMLAGHRFLVYDFLTPKGGQLNDTIRASSRGGWFTAPPKNPPSSGNRKTTGRARQPSDKGTHEESRPGNSQQRVGSRSHNHGDVWVQRAHILTAPADFKRLISYPKRERTESSQEPEGMPVCP